MKLYSSIISHFGVAGLLLALMLTSCSKEVADRRADLLNAVPDNASIIAFNPAAILESAGAKIGSDEIELTKQLDRLKSADNPVATYLDIITSADGINHNSTVAGGNNDGYFWLLAIDNACKFKSWADDNGFEITETENYTVCIKQTASFPLAIVADGDIAWFVSTAPSVDDAVKTVENNKQRASQGRLADWKRDRLTDSDINILIDIPSYTEMMNSIMAMTGIDVPAGFAPQCVYSVGGINFEGPTIRFSADAFDADGKKSGIFADGTYEAIPSAMLALVKDSQLALGFSIPDAWKEMFGKLAAAEMVNFGQEYSDMINSALGCLKSMVAGFSLNDDCSISDLKPTDISGTVAINYDKTQAEKVSADMIALSDADIAASLSNGYKAWTEDSTFIISPTPQFPDFKIYFTGKDDVALISTDASLSDTELKSDSSLEGVVSYISVDIKKQHPLLTMVGCPFGIKIYGTCTNEKTEGYITLTDTDGQLIETIINFIGRL